MRIAIVNDLKMALYLLVKLIEKDGHEVAWTALDAEEAVKFKSQDPPDLILMDLIMAVLGGLAATKKIMSTSPCSILLVTSTIEGNLSHVFEALGHGALDVVRTPPLEIDALTEGGQELLTKIKNIGLLIGNTKKRVSLQEISAELSQVQPGDLPPLLVVGASTGGPLALVALLSQIPADISFAVVIIQHIDQEFAPGFAQWLDGQCLIKVILAEEGAVAEGGKIYIAAKNRHLTIGGKGQFSYLNNYAELLYKPSIDIFFSSVAANWPSCCVAVLLTGMGSDGAQGLKELRNKGWFTIVEDKSSCVVYGMPKAAVAIDATDAEEPLEKLTSRVLKQMAACHSRIKV